MYRENIGEEEILSELRILLSRYAKEREDGEHFGDFVIRAGIIKATTDGTNFHD
jgi:sulfite reductase (NADPH) hemoprotein beta-component